MDEVMQKKLNNLQTLMVKQFGKGSIFTGSNKEIAEVEKWDLSSIKLMNLLGGGFPKGRVIEIYGSESSGKTTLATIIAGDIQRQGGVIFFIDMEHAFDPIYAKQLGLDTDNDTFLFAQPDSGEEALEMAEKAVSSGAVSLIIIDSVAALVPKAEIEGEMGDAHIGLQARLMSQALRKLTALLSNNKTSIIFVNQTRNRIGVMWGCLHYDTQIPFVDGRTYPIGEIVDNKIKGDVWAYDVDNDKYIASPIIDWFDNGKVVSQDDYIHIQTESINGGGRFGITVTKDHKILTDKGWKSAKEIQLEDKLQSKYLSIINGTLKDFLTGTFVGDSTIYIRNKNTACVKIQDNSNVEYMKWKIEKLSPFFDFKEVHYNNKIRYESNYIYELVKIKKELGERDPFYFFKNYSDLGLAIWFMDYGYLDNSNKHCRYSLSVGRIHNHKVLEQIVQLFKEKVGVKNPSYDKNSIKGLITFNKQDTYIIANKIKNYIPDCMQYKLPEEFRNQYIDFELHNNPTIKSEFVKITMIRPSSKRQFRNKRKFDLKIKDYHNYIAGGKYNGIVVHNSNETTSGGNALKFYASIRMDVRRVEWLKHGDEVYGQRIRIKTVKNKVASPFKKEEFDLEFGKGFNIYKEYLEMGVTYNLIDKAGTWYSYKNEKLGQGKENASLFLKEHTNIFESLKKELFKVMYPKKQEKDILKEEKETKKVRKIVSKTVKNKDRNEEIELES